jgi:hypothetical protein
MHELAYHDECTILRHHDTVPSDQTHLAHSNMGKYNATGQPTDTGWQGGGPRN